MVRLSVAGGISLQGNACRRFLITGAILHEIITISAGGDEILVSTRGDD